MVLLSLSVIFKSVWYVQDFEYTSACDAHVRLKTEGTAIKIAKETTNDQQKKYNSVKHLQRQQISFTKTSTESKVSLKLLNF